MSKNTLAIKKSDVNVAGAVSGSVIINIGQAYKAHMKDIVLQSDGNGTMTIRDKYDNKIIEYIFDATHRSFELTGADIFGGGGRVMMDLNAAITVTGTIMYWKEDLGHSVVKKSVRRNDG